MGEASKDELQNEINSMRDFITRYIELEPDYKRPKEVYGRLPGGKEEKIHQLLQYFLDPQESHGFGRTFLGAFLKALDKNSEVESKTKAKNIQVNSEVQVSDESSDGKIDMIVAGGKEDGHPNWAYFIELKVGQRENEGGKSNRIQTQVYKEANDWKFDWSPLVNKIEVDQLEKKEYRFVKRENSDPSNSNGFKDVNWVKIVSTLEEELPEPRFFEFPYRSVMQVQECIKYMKKDIVGAKSLKPDEHFENFDKQIQLLLDHKDILIQGQKSEQINEKIKDELKSKLKRYSEKYIQTEWKQALDEFNFGETNWSMSSPSNENYKGRFERIKNEHWSQERNSGTVQTSFIHSTRSINENFLYNEQLRFGLRLPPLRSPQREDFNGYFVNFLAEKIQQKNSVINEKMSLAMDEWYKPEKLNGASQVIEVKYNLEQADSLEERYFKTLSIACEDFCQNEPLLNAISEAYEEAYKDAFREGLKEENRPSPLKRK